MSEDLEMKNRFVHQVVNTSNGLEASGLGKLQTKVVLWRDSGEQN